MEENVINKLKLRLPPEQAGKGYMPAHPPTWTLLEPATNKGPTVCPPDLCQSQQARKIHQSTLPLLEPAGKAHMLDYPPPESAQAGLDLQECQATSRMTSTMVSIPPWGANIWALDLLPLGRVITNYTAPVVPIGGKDG